MSGNSDNRSKRCGYYIDVLHSTSILIPSSSDSFVSLWRLVLHQRADSVLQPVQRFSSFSFSSLISFSLSEYISIERFPNVFRKEDFRGEFRGSIRVKKTFNLKYFRNIRVLSFISFGTVLIILPDQFSG